MRVLLLTHLFLPSVGGAQRSVYNLARLLQDRGHEVLVASHSDDARGVSLGRYQDVEVVSMRVPSPFDTGAYDRLRRRLLDTVNARGMSRWCERRGIEIVHCHLINADTRYAYAAARRTGARVVLTLRGGETEHWVANRPARAAYVRAMLEQADGVTAVAEDLLAQARGLADLPAARARVVPNPADPDRLRRLADEAGRASTEGTPEPADLSIPYYLFVGRLEPMKDVATLVDAYHLLRASGDAPGRELVIVGGGSLEPILRRQAREGAGADGIRFLGERGHGEALRLILHAEAVVLPSVSSEGCPNAALEAMALGTPVLVSDIPSLREMVDEGRAGAVFPAGDPAALAAGAARLAKDRELRESLIHAGRRRVTERHRPEAVAAAYEEIYRDVLAHAPHSRNRAS